MLADGIYIEKRRGTTKLIFRFEYSSTLFAICTRSVFGWSEFLINYSNRVGSRSRYIYMYEKGLYANTCR